MDVDVGLWHQKERQTCLFGSGTRRGWLVARGSVCQMQVVSNHSSGVAARNHPFWQGSRAGTWGQMPGTARASRPSVQSLSGGARSPNQLTPGDPDPQWIRPEAAPSCCLPNVPVYLCTCVPRFDSRSADETQIEIVLYLPIRESSRGGYLGRPQEDDYSSHHDRQALSVISPGKGATMWCNTALWAEAEGRAHAAQCPAA